MGRPNVFVVGDTASKLIVTCKDDKGDGSTPTVINLTGATVRLKYRIEGGALQTKTMTITSAAGGVVEYQFLTGELTVGNLLGEVEITDSLGKVVTNRVQLLFPIRAKT